jgi:methylphosphotriester-DNA--protein-cysteine methyltransferase
MGTQLEGGRFFGTTLRRRSVAHLTLADVVYPAGGRLPRLEYVRRKLDDPELSLAEIAVDAGFADQSHLTRNFKRFTGRTPGEYRTFLRFKTG